MRFSRWRYIVPLRLRSLWSGTTADRELDDELRFHVDQQIEANIAGGMTPEAARTSALRAIGGVEQRKEECRDARGTWMFENLVRDGRLAVRQLRKHPGFTLTAVVSLALGIGANTAIFQLLNALSLRALPVRAPHELVEVRLTGDGLDGWKSGRNRQVSLPQYQEFDRRQQAFSATLAFGDTRFNLSPRGEVRYVDGLWVSGSFFEMLGVQPLLGRLVGPSDDQPGCGRLAAVISYSLWQSDFGGRSDVVGQLLPIAGSRVPIIGVTPQSFFGIEVGRQFGVAMPLCASGITQSNHWWLAMIGRLKPGWTPAQARAHLGALMPAVQQATMPEYRAELAAGYLGMGIDVVDASSGVSPLRRDYQRPLWILLAISALVLLIAAVNLANLLLARAAARRPEFAVRLALGGTRGRILQQLLTESALIAAIGSSAAVGVALVMSRSIPPLMSTALDRIHLDLAPDWRFFGFTAAAGALAAMIFGTVPALRATRASLLRGDRGHAANDGLTVRRTLVALQVAVTLVLLVGGLLFLQTLRNLSGLDTGVHERGIIVATVTFDERAYPPQRRGAAFRAIDERLASLPSVVGLASASVTPFSGSFWDPDVESDARITGVPYGNRISPGYFATLGIRLIAGRDFNDRDAPGGPAVAVVNESFAAQFFGGPPIGRRFSLPADGGGPGRQFDVVGLVANQKYADIREHNPPIFYVPSAQETELGTTRRYAIRSLQSAEQTVAAVTAAVATFDSTLAIRCVLLDAQVGDALLQERLMARLSAIFGLVALVLAVVGLYGVVSYTVASRQAEIGVRVALGATRWRILALILGDVGRMIAAGLAVGGVLAIAAGRAIASLLYGLEPADPLTLVIAAAVLAGAGVMAAVSPSRRATGIDPVRALRES